MPVGGSQRVVRSAKSAASQPGRFTPSHDADLAEILATIEIESEIPLEALAAVAEILSYVYRNQSKIAPAKIAPARGAAESAV